MTITDVTECLRCGKRQLRAKTNEIGCGHVSTISSDSAPGFWDEVEELKAAVMGTAGNRVGGQVEIGTAFNENEK
jgi:hypothetical protein